MKSKVICATVGSIVLFGIILGVDSIVFPIMCMCTLSLVAYIMTIVVIKSVAKDSKLWSLIEGSALYDRVTIKHILMISVICTILAYVAWKMPVVEFLHTILR